jgi:type I restriction enzyme S subunit
MSPFDKALYERLLKGLEATEMTLSEVRADNDKLRIDSGYFAKPVLLAEQRVRGFAKGYDELGSLFSRFVKGIFDINADAYVDEGVPFIRIQNLKEGLIDSRGLAYIPEDVHKSERKTALLKGDIVLSKTAYPAASLVTLERANTSQDTIATTLSEHGRAGYRAAAIVAYLNSATGQTLLWRQFQGNVQLHLSLDDGRKVPMPRFSDDLQAAVEKCFHEAEMLRASAAEQMARAEQALLHALGLAGWIPPEALSYVRSSNEAFAAGRLDAQFFAPRVEQLLARLRRDGLILGEVAPVRHERFEPADAGDFEYIEIGSVGADGTAASENVPMAEAPSRATQRVRTGDVITSTVRPIRRLSALVAPEQDGAVCSSGFVVLRPLRISGEVLLTYLRLPVVCELMDLHTSATMYPAISESDLLRLPIPAISAAVQSKVNDAVQQSAVARQRATHLLDSAKRAVERAIGEGESAALRYLKGV